MIVAVFFGRRIIAIGIFCLILAAFPFCLSAYDFVGWGRGALQSMNMQ